MLQADESLGARRHVAYFRSQYMFYSFTVYTFYQYTDKMCKLFILLLRIAVQIVKVTHCEALSSLHGNPVVFLTLLTSI